MKGGPVRAIFTMDELLAMRSNAWACECGRVYQDTTRGVAVPVVDGDPECAHRVLRRAAIVARPA